MEERNGEGGESCDYKERYIKLNFQLGRVLKMGRVFKTTINFGSDLSNLDTISETF